MGIETALLAAAVGDRRKKAQEEKKEQKKRTAAASAGFATDKDEKDAKQRLGRASLIQTSSRGVLNPANVGRKRLSIPR